VTELQEQTQDEYDTVNGPTNMADEMVKRGFNIDIDALQNEVNNGKCQLVVTNPLQRPDEDHLYFVQDVKQVVRLVRLLRVKIKANTPNGKRVLLEGSEGCKDEQMRSSFKNFDLRLIGVKMCLDEVDVHVSLTEHLSRVLCVPESWQEQHLLIGKRADPKLMVGESRNFRGLVTWFLIEDLEVSVKEDSVQAGSRIMGLPNGSAFSREFAKSGENNATMVTKHWCWAEEDEDLFTSFAGQ
jgi:hypothetical protein